jgi:hypothetical protein
MRYAIVSIDWINQQADFLGKEAAARQGNPNVYVMYLMNTLGEY